MRHLVLSFLLISFRASAQVEEVFVFPDSSIHIEGVAYDSFDSSFYMGSVNTGKLYHLKQGKLEIIALPSGVASWSILGLAMEPGTRRLWLTRACLEESADTGHIGQSELSVLDLIDGSWNSWSAAEQAKRITFNDLLISDGIVWVTDNGRPGGLWKLTKEGGEIFRVPLKGPRSPQGIVAQAEGIYLADYSRGIWQLDPGDTTGTLLRAALEDGKRLFYDGLLSFKSGFIAICNNNNKRIVALEPSGDTLAARTIVSLDNPRYDEPTLGVHVGPWLYFIANSQWGSYTDPKKRKPAILARVRID
jgi:hypothetical protein